MVMYLSINENILNNSLIFVNLKYNSHYSSLEMNCDSFLRFIQTAVLCGCRQVLKAASDEEIAHLQRSKHDFLDRREVGLPQELRLLAERQNAILMDRTHGGWDL